MNWKRKNALTKSTRTVKSFAYNKGTVRLNFTVNVEDKKELLNFRECLENALKDTNEEISNLK